MKERIKQNLNQRKVEGLSQEQMDIYVDQAAQIINPLRQNYEKQIRKFLRQLENDYIENIVLQQQQNAQLSASNELPLKRQNCFIKHVQDSEGAEEVKSEEWRATRNQRY